eukprot:Skav228466  [mRNA]  locus=scaffold1233:34393:36015:+ [translate_table: standard]
MASGHVAAKEHGAGRMPLDVQIRSLHECGLFGIDPGILPSTEDLFPDRPWHEDPEWIKELSDSLHFRELFRFKFHLSGHINVNESRTYKSWIKSMAKSEPGSRFVGLLDSRVTIGASTKGRSSSPAISRVLQGSMAYVIGGDLYPGLLHCYSGDNRADEPSRNKPLRPPTKELPTWLLALQKGETRPFDCVVASSRFSKNPARWLRLLLLLGGDIEPNPGPQYVPRGELEMSTGFVPATAQRMERCLSAFRLWCENEEFDWNTLTAHPYGLALALRGYGLHCFAEGFPRYLFVYAITAAQDAFPLVRNYLSLAWQVDKKWQIHEPGTCRAVLPPLVIRAALCLGALWNWPSWVGIVLLGFSAMLHPSEMMALTRGDLIFPSDLNYDHCCLFLRISNPKTARFARRQHGRIDDPCVIRVVESIFGKLKAQQKLYPSSVHVFRRQWNSIMTRLGVPHTQNEHGATPGVLRGSGATFLYAGSEDITWIAWRGRWSKIRTLEYYLQEVAAYVLVHSLSSSSRARIDELSRCSWCVLKSKYLAGQ